MTGAIAPVLLAAVLLLALVRIVHLIVPGGPRLAGGAKPESSPRWNAQFDRVELGLSLLTGLLILAWLWLG